MRLHWQVMIGLALVLAASVQASPIIDVRIDFSNKSAAPTTTDQAGVAGTWNTVTVLGGPTPAVDYVTGLTDATVNGTITYTLGRTGTGSLLNDSNSTGNWTAANAGPSWLDSSKNAAMDALHGGNATGWQLIFSGLDPNQLYDVEVVSSYRTSSYIDPSNGLAYKAVGDTTVSYQWKAYANGYVAGDWLSWLQFKPAANGTITLSSQGGVGSSAGVINAARLYAIPEPATLVLASLGLVGLLRKR